MVRVLSRIVQGVRTRGVAMTDVITVTSDDAVWAALITEIVKANHAAKAPRRKGYIGIASATYAHEHQHLNDLLTSLEAMS